MHMRSLFIMAAVAAMTLAACKGRGTNPADKAADTTAIIHDKAITGQWYIRSVVLNDSPVRPSVRDNSRCAAVYHVQ